MAEQRIHPIDLEGKLEVGQDEASIDRLIAVMLFPYDKNPKKENDVEAAETAKDLEHSQAEYLRSIAVHRDSSMASSPYSTFSSRIAKGVNDGIVAGSCLMYFRFLDQTEVNTKAGNRLEASKRAAFYLCKNHNLARDREADRNEIKSYPTVTIPETRKIWESYRRVSHLWAAYIHLEQEGNPSCIKREDLKVKIASSSKSSVARKTRNVHRPIEYDAFALECVDFSVLLFLARQYERFAVKFFNGEKTGKTTRDKFSPFRARYFDWNADDVLAMEIPELDHLSYWAANTSKEYVPDL